MKKTIQVNLSGQVFTLDEDAYDRLSAYLNQIVGFTIEAQEKKRFCKILKCALPSYSSKNLES